MRAANRPTSDSLLTELRERYDYAAAEWADLHREGREDMRYVSGDPWTEQDKLLRQGRPTVAPDELHQYFNQVINDLRANPLAVRFAPTGNGANDKGAEFYANKTREIEYRSDAQVAYIAAAENAIQRSYGWVRVLTKYSTVPGQRFSQDLWIDPVPNPDMVLADPEAKRPDSGDMRFLFFCESWPIKEYTRSYPRATVHNFTSEHLKVAPAWLTAETVLLAEYWTITTRPRRLLLVQIPGGPQQPPQLREFFEDEFGAMPEGIQVVQQRMIEWPTVCSYLTNGVEILGEKTEWPGQYIPFVSCFGKVLYVNTGAGSRRQLLSMTRFGREPWKAFCYACSSQLEVLGMTPKTPVQGVSGQFRGHERDYQRALHEPVPYLEYEATTEKTGATVLPPPQRMDYLAATHLQATELVKEGFRRSIQAAMGTNFLPTSAQRRNEKSGVALERIEDAGQRGSFHFKDHYKGMIQRVGVILEDLIDKIYDTPGREVGVRKPNEAAETVRINDDRDPDSVHTRGDYLVTVNVGPSDDSQREAQQDLAETLLQSPFAPRIIDLVLKLRGSGPIIDEIADRLTPPEFRSSGEEGPPSPAQLQFQLSQALAQIKALSQELQARTQQVETDSLKLQAEHDLQIELQRMKNAATIRVAEINAAVKGYQVEAQHAAAHEAQALEQSFEAEQAAQARTQETAMAQMPPPMPAPAPVGPTMSGGV